MSNKSTTSAILGGYKRRTGGNRVTNEDWPSRPKFKEGLNFLRLFPFEHTITDIDVLRGDLGLEENDIGDRRRFLFTPVVLHFLGGKGGRVVVGRFADFRCPLWKAYYDTPKEERNPKEKPRQYFAVNYVDLAAPGDGMKIGYFTPSEFLGQRSSWGGPLLSYGMLHLIEGYPLEGEADESKKKEDEEAGISAPGGQGGALPPFEGYGWAILGHEGKDIVLAKCKSPHLKNMRGEPQLVTDIERNGGVMVKEKDSVVLPADQYKANDLFWNTSLFPGRASDGDHLSHPAAPNLVNTFMELAQIYREEGEEAVVTKRAAKLSTPASPVSSESNGIAQPDDGRLVKGMKVTAVDENTDQGVTTRTVFIGKVVDVEQRGGVEVVNVELSPEDQGNDETKASVEEAIENAGTNVFTFARDKVKLDDFPQNRDIPF